MCWRPAACDGCTFATRRTSPSGCSCTLPAGYNLGLLMRKCLGVGKPRCLQGQSAALWAPPLFELLRSERAGWRKRFEREASIHQGTEDRPQVLEARDLVVKMLALVDLETQAAAIHYHVDEMTLDEVATLMGRSVPTIRKRLEEFAALCGKEFSP